MVFEYFHQKSSASILGHNNRDFILSSASSWTPLGQVVLEVALVAEVAWIGWTIMRSRHIQRAALYSVVAGTLSALALHPLLSFVSSRWGSVNLKLQGTCVRAWPGGIQIWLPANQIGEIRVDLGDKLSFKLNQNRTLEKSTGHLPPIKINGILQTNMKTTNSVSNQPLQTM